MVIAEGYFYHIKDAYFSAVNEATLKRRKGDVLEA